MDAAQLEAMKAQLSGQKRSAAEANAAGAITKPAPLTELSTNATALNASNPEMLAGVLSGGEVAVPLKSDADEQLLLSLSLPQTHKLTAIRLAGPSDGTAPSTVKLFVNKLSMSFDDCEDFCPTQTLTLTSAEQTIQLAPTKFTNVSSLSVFIEGNQGDEEATCLSSLGLVGVPVHTTNMKDLKKGG